MAFLLLHLLLPCFVTFYVRGSYVGLDSSSNVVIQSDAGKNVLTNGVDVLSQISQLNERLAQQNQMISQLNQTVSQHARAFSEQSQSISQQNQTVSQQIETINQLQQVVIAQNASLVGTLAQLFALNGTAMTTISQQAQTTLQQNQLASTTQFLSTYTQNLVCSTFSSNALFPTFQQIDTNGARDWEFLTIANTSYLTVANFYGATYNIPSKIYRFDPTSSQFTLMQQIDTNGAFDWEFFTIADNSYLAVANHYNGTTYNIPSKIYRFDPTTSQFILMQQIDTIRLGVFHHCQHKLPCCRQLFQRCHIKHPIKDISLRPNDIPIHFDATNRYKWGTRLGVLHHCQHQLPCCC